MVVPEPARTAFPLLDDSVHPVDCKGATRLNAGRVRDQAEFGAATAARQPRPLLCPAKGCDAPCAITATGSYPGHSGGREFLFYEATCINGHSTFARRVAPENVATASPAAQAAPVPAITRAMFDRVVANRYRELHRIAENALDGGKIPGADDCVQQAIASLLLHGSYATCADDGEMFGQLVLTVQNRAKATIKRWATNRTRHRSLVTEDVRQRRWSGDDDELVGQGVDREMSSDGTDCNEAADRELRPRCVARTRDLRLDVTGALCEEPPVPLDVQLVLVDEMTRIELLTDVDPDMRHLRRATLDNSITRSRDRLARRLQDYQTAHAQTRKWRGGLLVPHGANERRYAQRWVDALSAAFRRALRQRRDTSLFQRFSVK
jgi:hypothetical protein